MMHPRHQQGFTLIELIAVIMVGAIMAGTLTVFLKPALDTYGDTRVRADLADQGDTALRRMLRDVRRSVPNSLRLPSDQCFELVPASTGGRYRMGPDVTNDNAAGCSPSATCTAWVDPTQTTSMFDTLSPLSVTPGIGDWIVINNQNGNDVYTGANRSPITNTVTAPPSSTQGYHRISMTAMQVPQAYNGGGVQHRAIGVLRVLGCRRRAQCQRQRQGHALPRGAQLHGGLPHHMSLGGQWCGAGHQHQIVLVCV
jgi:MSHA biogenesis protein MshO